MSTHTPSTASSGSPASGGPPGGEIGTGALSTGVGLQEIAVQLQPIIDGTRHPTFVKDLQGRYLQVNQGFERLVGLSKDKIISRTSEEIVPRDTALAFQNLDVQALVTPGGAETEVSFTRDGETHTFKINKFPLRDTLGRICAIFGFAYDITDRKRAEEALQLSEEKFRQLAENINEVFWINDAAKNETIYVSPAYEQIWGLPCETLLRSSLAWLDAVHPDDRPRVSAAARIKHATGEYDERFRIVRPDGTIRWIRARAFPLRNALGEIYRLVGLATDITELQRIQAELAMREEQYRGVFSAVTEGLTVREMDGTLVEANPAYAKLLGYSREELFQLTPADVVPPDFLPLYNAYLQTVRKGEAFTYEGMLKRKDGTLVRVEVIGTLLHYDRRTHLLNTVRDVTAQKNAEEALRKSEAEFRVTFENAPIGIELVAPDARLIRCNHALQELLGYSEKELQGMSYTQFTHPEEVPASLAKFRELMKGTADRQQVERRLVRKDGGLVNARVTVSAVRTTHGEPQYAIAMIEDITEQKKLEEQFLRAQRLESIGMLAGGIAHDLNNILAPMLMAGGLLKDKLTEPRDQAIVTIIEKGAQRGAGIIRQLLTFSRGHEGQKGRVELQHLIGETVNIIRETFPRQIEVSAEVPANLWAVNGNGTQLHQVLMNLCVNSRDAMPNGGRLSISADNVTLSDGQAKLNLLARPGRYVMVTVADTGSGIPKEIIDRIFEPFFTTKGVEQGTGLGLSTVLNIVKNHEGFVTVASEPAKGTEFKVYLPAINEVRADAAERTVAAPTGHGELLLLVDDEAPVREATQRVLEANRYRVVTAVNGAQALETFMPLRDDIRLVVTDMMMPVMDGPHLVLALHLVEPALKVVAMSGLDHTSTPEELSALGINEIVPKPCEARHLLLSIHRALTTTVPAPDNKGAG